MKIVNYNEKIKSFLESNSAVPPEKLGLLLMIDSLYEDVPKKDVDEFRSIYAHLNPNVVNGVVEGITFIQIAKALKPPSGLKEKLNDYLNVKFNDIEHCKSYSQNMEIFARYADLASQVITEILRVAVFPPEIATVLQEKEEVKKCRDIYQMLVHYKNTKDKRIRFEILRKLGLIVLISRINRSQNVDEIDQVVRQVVNAFAVGLGFNKESSNSYYLWLDRTNRVIFNNNKARSRLLYSFATKKRKQLALDIHPLQECQCDSFRTHRGNKVVHFEFRNKFKKSGQISYASFIEKMFRKNLEFPSQIHDTVGIKLVVDSENDIHKIVADLEGFLGGSSTRKRQKNTYHRFDQRKMNSFAAEGYTVWKAIYDIALTNPAIDKIKKLIKATSGNDQVQQELKERLHYLLQKPQDFVVEVQLQDISSYLLSVAEGSVTNHALLKARQIRLNSFYKFFPQEIYESEVLQLKQDILRGNDN
ncbi:hypothetical protein KJ903_02230 [Patescibacteria group bacterium]|nr:hypothetical protein [Patescibacteria group bacterium]